MPSPYTGGKSMQSTAPAAALSAAHNALDAAIKQTQGPPSIGSGKPMPQMPSSAPPTQHMQSSMGKPQQRVMNPTGMMHQQPAQNMPPAMPTTGSQVCYLWSRHILLF